MSRLDPKRRPAVMKFAPEAAQWSPPPRWESRGDLARSNNGITPLWLPKGPPKDPEEGSTSLRTEVLLLAAEHGKYGGSLMARTETLMNKTDKYAVTLQRSIMILNETR